MVKQIKYVHRGYVRESDGVIILDHPSMYASKLHLLRGKRFSMVLEEEKEKPNQSQFAYYFAGIIRAECMSSESFAGWTENEIHIHLLKTITSYNKTLIYPSGQEVVVECHDTREDFKSYSKEEMSRYISLVISYLNTELSIFPKDPEQYKFEKYQRILKMEAITNANKGTTT